MKTSFLILAIAGIAFAADTTQAKPRFQLPAMSKQFSQISSSKQAAKPVEHIEAPK